MFEAIARYMVRSLHADFAYVSRISDEGPHKLTTLAMYYSGKLRPNSTYALEGTACSHVLGKAFHFVGSNLLECYPGMRCSAPMGSTATPATRCSPATGARWG